MGCDHRINKISRAIFYVQTCQGERENHPEHEEANNLNCVVVGFQIQMWIQGSGNLETALLDRA
jgi:hypothetical protein